MLMMAFPDAAGRVEVKKFVKLPVDYTALSIWYQPGSSLVGETKRLYISTLQCAMRACLQKATAMHPFAIFFLLHCSAKPQNCGLVLAFFSLLSDLGAISLIRAAFHMESEKYTVSSSPPPAKAPGYVMTQKIDILQKVGCPAVDTVKTRI